MDGTFRGSASRAGACARRDARRFSGRRRRVRPAAAQDRLRHEPDRPARRQRQGGADRDGDLARRRQRQGRDTRPQGRVRLLRRPDQSRDGAQHLRQAARRGQGGPRRLGLRHQRDRPGDADHDAAQAHLHEPVRAERQLEIQVRPLLPDHAGRSRPGDRLVAGILRRGDGRSTRSRRRSRSWARTPSTRHWRWKARARTPRRPGSTSSTTRPIRRRPSTTRPSCARSRRPIRTSSSSRPTRPIRPEWCALRTKWVSRRACSAAAWSARSSRR